MKDIVERIVRPAHREAAEAAIRRGTGGSSPQLAAALAAGVKVADRRYRLKKYPECFVGSEAVDWLGKHYRIGREDAVALGDALAAHFGLRRAEATTLGQSLADLGLLRHVADAHPFADDFLFYRLATVQRARKPAVAASAAAGRFAQAMCKPCPACRSSSPS